MFRPRSNTSNRVLPFSASATVSILAWKSVTCDGSTPYFLRKTRIATGTYSSRSRIGREQRKTKARSVSTSRRLPCTRVRASGRFSSIESWISSTFSRRATSQLTFLPPCTPKA